MITNCIPDKLSFTFYKEEEIVKMSVLEITKPLSLDAFDHPYADGLCDPRLGPHVSGAFCKTCNLSIISCPGHFGYIKLARPVFNPLVFSTMYSLLKSTCHKCGYLKIGNYDRIIYYLKLNLLKRNRIIDNLDYLYSINNENELHKRVTDLLLSCESDKIVSSNFYHQEFVQGILRASSSRTKCVKCQEKSIKMVFNKNLKISLQSDVKSNVKTLYPEDIIVIFEKLFCNEKDLIGSMFSTTDYKMFFIYNISVSPVKFRPVNVYNGRSYENPQNIHYIRIIGLNNQIMEGEDYYTELQAAILVLFDSSKSTYSKHETVPGHKQILEKKEGLFRRNIMGKRVNFAARSVISPDPHIETREIGVPLVFAEKLTFPEKVNASNYDMLRKAVINGKTYPGANAIEEGNRIQSLEVISHEKRVALANQLLIGNKCVRRHLQTGDVVLVNRQPTLHKQSIMAHKVKVLPGEKTLRIHYVNCKPYNADFDGDEMNIHFPQSQVARAEAEHISLNDNMYFVSTDGEPIRGLTQDHIVAASVLSLKNSFFTKEQYSDLLTSGLRGRRLVCEEPCISQPVEMYSGKQVVTSLLKSLDININLTKKCKIDASSWGDHIEEANAVFYNGMMISGLLDKSILGPTKFSLVHAAGQLYGYNVANDLLTYFSRIVNRYLLHFGFTLRMDDLLLCGTADIARNTIIHKGNEEAARIQDSYTTKNCDFYINTTKTAQLDALIREKMNSVTTEIVKACLPDGQLKRFPENNMGMIIATGAKGSIVNLSQISGLLGQQELEGKRVSYMVSGKTLPCFEKLANKPASGGYIFQRFLTGINPPEYFFHCMAGREGLIDTAVKTSRSGYLQRCLIKHLEGCKTEYDMSVRMGDKIIQYVYGEDGLDCTKSSFISNIDFYTQNNNSASLSGSYCNTTTVGSYTTIVGCNDIVANNMNSNTNEGINNMNNPTSMNNTNNTDNPTSMNNTNNTDNPTSMNNTNNTDNPTSMNNTNNTDNPTSMNNTNNIINNSNYTSNTDSNTKFTNNMTNSENTTDFDNINNPINIDNTDYRHQLVYNQEFINSLNSCNDRMKKVFYKNYTNALVDPGEAVGVLAGQSVGEPSTQMTLNTFHLAGVGAQNVTLGIPRLREIIMVASKKIQTPITIVPVLKPVSCDIVNAYKRITLEECIDVINVNETICQKQGVYMKQIQITITIAKCEKIAVPILDTQLLYVLGKKIRKLGKISGDINILEIKTNTVTNKTEEDDSDTDDSTSTQDDELPDEKEDTNAVDEDDDIIQMEEEVVNDEHSEDENEECIKTMNFKKVGHKKYMFTAWYPSDFNIMLIQVIKAILPNIVVKEHRATTKATLNNDHMIIEGSDFHSLVDLVYKDNGDVIDPLKYFDLYKAKSNDIYAIATTFGIEAARASIINEIASVFDAYGIEVNIRHLMLIADYMTRTGEYKAFNRVGLGYADSPIQKMSFESCFVNIKKASEYHMTDDLVNPSASLAVGAPVQVGTAVFDLLYDMDPHTE